MPLRNIPTDLLRTLIALVDLRSFTRAAQSLGVTQPAVSAQIKRLQVLIGAEILDKSAPGVTLTDKGEMVVKYARRMLSLNDQMLDVTARRQATPKLRIGLPVDYFEGPILRTLGRFRAAHVGSGMQISTDPSEALIRDFRRGEYDLILAASEGQPDADQSRFWLERSAWAAASPSVVPAKGPVPLLVLRETSLSRRLSVAALESAGIEYEIIYVGGSFAGLVQAVSAGLGVACWAKHCLADAGLTTIDSAARLPRVRDVWAGVHLRDGADPMLEKLADDIAASVRAVTGEPPQSVRQAAVC